MYPDVRLGIDISSQIAAFYACELSYSLEQQKAFRLWYCHRIAYAAPHVVVAGKALTLACGKNFITKYSKKGFTFILPKPECIAKLSSEASELGVPFLPNC